MCQTSESRQPLLCNNVSVTSFTLTPPTPESSSSSSPADRYQPLNRELLRPSSDTWIVTPPGVSLFLTSRNITGVSRCVVFPGSEDPCCSCSWSTRGSTSLALFPIPSPVGSSQFVHRILLCQSSDACIVPPPDAVLFRTMRYVNEVRRGVVFPWSKDPCRSCYFLTRGGTLTALIPPTLVDCGTGGGRLRVSDINRLKFRYMRLGRMSVCVRMCRRIRSQLRKSDA